MSEQINNREYRQEVIKQVISELHQGKTVDEVKRKFEEAFSNVSVTEITEAEQALIAEGLPISEVQRLCDVHAAVFKGSIEEIHQTADKSLIPGHPANVLKRENQFIEHFIDTEINEIVSGNTNNLTSTSVKHTLNKLYQIDKHYLIKENLLFPYMEKYGITAPPKVMWGVDDEIRDEIKDLITYLSDKTEVTQDFIYRLDKLSIKIKEMIFKEENIMLPMLLDTLTQDEWKKIADESRELGYIIEDVPVWNPTPDEAGAVESEKKESGVITMPTGVLRFDEVIRMLNTMPFDITFVDKDDIVKYFSEGSERIFPRTKAVIGRNVANCHPPASVHVVEKIVEDFKSGTKDHEDFWINMGDKFVLIRYFAVRSEGGEYLGVLEVTQNIKPIQEIKGEKRLASE